MKLLKSLNSNPYLRPTYSTSRHSGCYSFRGSITPPLSYQPMPKSWWKHFPKWRQFRREFTTTDLMLGGLVSTNFVVFLLWEAADQKSITKKFMIKHFTLGLNNFMTGHIHTVLTCAFSHKRFRHFLFNMIGMYICGRRVGLRFGPEVLLQLYLAGGMGGSTFFLIRQAFLVISFMDFDKHDPSKALALGGSAAIMAIMAFDLLSSVAEIRSPEFVNNVPFILLELNMVGRQIAIIVKGKGNGSHIGHLGGLIFGIIAWFALL